MIAPREKFATPSSTELHRRAAGRDPARLHHRGDCTSGGVLHAVTSAAQRVDNADTAYEMERKGLQAMSLAAAHARAA